MTWTSPPRRAVAAACALVLAGLPVSFLPAQGIPHGQDRPPGPALSPEEARKNITVPEGFRVEIFASEPDIVNPVTMCFDEKGRIWIAESLEYPRRDPGPGRDRIKILEDTDSDGKADKFTVFADGLNIPCGVAVGHGGVFVTNSPDILFLEDTDGDGKADRREVVVTGFGRSDTHELPNTLTWGPDGWLYGLNGVFNPARVTQKGKDHRFDAALWRYHPVTRDFELFAEGTSNPWGLAFDGAGNAFVSACVIDHLYHLAETGYYHRQAGAYPPFTWKIESIVEHAHQKAAYCGLAFYDADVYPEEYRGRIFMGNIHGNCINADRLERRGATYLAQPEKDFLSGNDSWFMPVCIRLGPDGCFYVLDWYDRYHCYQDANRDPKGIDRLKGRLYRIAYGKAPAAGKIDLAAEATEKLVGHLASPNLWWRTEAQRILSRRIAAGEGGEQGAAAAAVERTVLDEKAAPKTRAHALWALVSSAGARPPVLRTDLHLRILSLADPTLRAWGVRAAGNLRVVDGTVRARVKELARDPSADVRLQVAVAARKLLEGEESVTLLLDVLAASEGDPLIPQIVWRNLEPLLEAHGEALASRLETAGASGVRPVEPIVGRIVERLVARKDGNVASAAALVAALLAGGDGASRAPAQALDALSEAALNRVIREESLATIQERLKLPVGRILANGRADPLYFSALCLAAAWREPAALAMAREILLDPKAETDKRERSLDALLASRDSSILEAAAKVLGSPGAVPDDFARKIILGLGRLGGPEVASVLLGAIDGMPPPLRPQAFDVLAGRPEWATALLDAVEAKKIERSALNVNQVRKILALGDGKLKERVGSTWGQVRTDRNPEREKIIQKMRRALEEEPGDPWVGRAVFDKTCAQCHLLFGRGTVVGPDITVNGRETTDAILSNILDPNLVIGKGYESWTCVTTDGRALNGLLVEDSDQRAVIKVAGGKEEVVPRGEIASLAMSQVSLMPEDLEKTLTQEELRGLITYLRYEEAPPEPVSIERAPSDGEKRIAVEQAYGEVVVSARFPGGDGGKAGATPPVEVLRYHHSNDQRPYIHPLRAPGLETVLTHLRPEDHPWQYGVFTGHARVNGLDFWHEKGWIRSRGLASVREAPDRIEIVGRSDWLTERRNGKRVLLEEQRITVHAPRSRDRYRIDFEWRLTPDADVTLGRYEYGGLALRPAEHEERRHARAAGEGGHAWQDVSGVFGEGDDAVTAGAAILDHPENPGFPSVWRVDDQGLINPAVSARGPVELKGGKTAVFRYRIVVHLGQGDKQMLDEEFREWAGRGPDTSR